MSIFHKIQYPVSIIKRIVEHPLKGTTKDRIVIDASFPHFCSTLCPNCIAGIDGKDRPAHKCSRFKTMLRKKQGNPVRCKKCIELFGRQ